LVFVFDFDVSHNHGQLLFMYIDSRYPIWHKLLLRAGAESVPRDYIKQGRGLSTLPLGKDNAHLFALSRTLRIRHAFGLNVSTDYSISPLPTLLDYRKSLSDFHEISRGT
jgi:hypothetical protein